MNTLNLPPLTPPPDPAGWPSPDSEPGTVRNWAGSQGLPAEVNLEPALADLARSDPIEADRVRAALRQFPAVGAEAAGFRLVALIGRGTFGRVYLARQGDLADRFVALKLSADLAGESQTLARLQHTNIVPIYSVHRAGPFQAVCMPFLGITTLAHLLKRYRGEPAVPATGKQFVATLRLLSEETDVAALGPRTDGPGTNSGDPGSVAREPGDRAVAPAGADRPRVFLDLLQASSYPDAVCWIGARLADGLAHAHAHGILHNDLKPANVLITDDGQPMLLDFGVAEDIRLRSPAPGATIGGTLPYMSPEHLGSIRNRLSATDARSDVYALGIILFEMLTGRHPFRVPTGTLDDELPRMLAERSGTPPSVRPLNPAVPAGLEAIVRKCLEPDPAHRYQSAADLRDDLDRHRAHLPLAHARVPARERVRKWAHRHPKLTSNLTLSALASALLALCTAGLYSRDRRIDRYEAEATARDLREDLKSAHYLLTARPPEPETVAGGVARCEAALARYGLPDDPRWEDRPGFRSLPANEQGQVRADLTEACLMLARCYALRAELGGEPPAASIRLNELAERVAAGSVPRAVWDQRAELLRRLGRPDDADRAADRARDTPLVTARDHYLAGAEALAAGRYRDALPLLRRSVDLDPAFFWAHMSLGACHEYLGQYPDAAGCYTAAIALWPDFHGGHYHRGLAWLRMREFARAKADLDRAAELNPDSPDPLLNRAIAFQGLREYAAGIRDLDRAIELGAPATRAVLTRARLRDLAGDKDGAKRDLAEGMRQDPTDEVGWVARGVARLRSDLPGALADFEAALRVNPRSLAALQNRAHVLSKLGRHPEAVRSLDQLLDLYPDYVPARVGRGVLHARFGDRDKALRDAEDALRRSQAASTSYQAAGIYAHLSKVEPGHRADAIRLLTAALRAGHGFEYVEADQDLDPIRNTPEFERVIESVRGLRPEAAAR